MSLTQYKKKRDFKKTPEPGGRKGSKDAALKFVVQRHKASRLHYDFRLEMKGVLKSWAIPKGPSLNPKDKRLAMMVEDHPLDYAGFEGVIPAPNYGAGIVEIWDKGNYEDLTEKDPVKAEKKLLSDLRKGSLKFILKGKKLKGEFALVKMKSTTENNAWLLIKHQDKFAVSKTYNSENQTDPGSPINRALKGKKKNDPPATMRKSSVKAAMATEKKYSEYIRPMLAGVARKPFSDSAWLFEIKWDGYRAIAEREGKSLKFYSRNGISFAEKYEPIAEALKKMHPSFVMDGEIVVMNEHDRPDFQKLQDYANNQSFPICYYAFDLLFYNGKNLRDKPLSERKSLLKKMLNKNELIRYSDHVVKNGEDFFKVAIEKNLEGIMAKKADSLYQSGKRSDLWLKIRNHQVQEAVVAGFTQPRGSRKFFGALILGLYNKKGKLEYAGHTGTGFTDHSLRNLHEKMQPLVRKNSPFNEPIPVNSPATWLKPELVCNIKFTEWTKSGVMRHPVFQGLRIDKAADEVIKEEAMPQQTRISRQKATVKKQTVKKSKAPKSKNEAAGENQKTITVSSRKLLLTNLNKIFWPEEKITKGEVIDYYNTMSKYILPYLKGRPQSLKRNPNGILDRGFFHKDAGDEAPDWVDTKKIFSESNQKEVNYILCNNKPTLIYLSNWGCVELNPWNSSVEKLDYPDYLILDIDPSEKNDYDDVVEAALAVKSVLDRAKAASFCKTSGATGMHVYVPLGARYDYDQARTFAELIARMTHELIPGISTLERSLKKRGKNNIYLDYLQNSRGQTLACAYSLRPYPGATVSTPLKWTEVKRGLRPDAFNLHTVPGRVAKTGDLFKGALGKGIDLKKCIRELEK